MPESVLVEMVSSNLTNPDYAKLVRFLVQPLLDSPAALKVDCEVIPAKARVWVRLAFEDSDKGRVFGRGGRTIQAIRIVLEAVAQAAGHVVHLDVYEGHEQPQRANTPKLSLKRRPPPSVE